MFVYCFQTAEDVVKLLSQPGSRIILVLRLALIPNCKGNPFSGGVRYTGGGGKNFVAFDQNRHLSLKRYEIGPLIGSRRWRIDPCSDDLY